MECSSKVTRDNDFMLMLGVNETMDCSPCKLACVGLTICYVGRMEMHCGGRMVVG